MIKVSKTEMQNRKNSRLSVLLMIIIIAIVNLFLNCTYNDENHMLYNVFYLSASVTVVLGSYAFYYKGKRYTIAKVLFFLSLIISILIFGGLKFLEAFGKGFNH
ncbi:hypothetical protein IW15_17960 [Chryseobacterium soli]|uniref:Uncharacterized protein n=1 Tax=Chryseobacterium soli TaxID=445961 RepID=A0A086A2Y3_9FLAO|nr:hypothetical protein [Chryseobacterium soli]KFF11047.1 hypothetical protein IW15_17960 [Chryseobacterium soli]